MKRNNKLLYINLCALLLILTLSLSSCSIFFANPLPDIDTIPNPKPTGVGTPEFNSPDKDTDATDAPIDPETCEHRFCEWETLVELGCFGIEGIKERRCEICGRTERLTESVDGHANIVKDAAKDATCSSEGLTEGIHCDTCGEVLLAQSVIPLRAHSYDGEDDAECNVCGFTRDVNCEHKNTSVIEAKEPTCIEPGYSEGLRCEDCGEMITEPQMIDALGHTEEIVKGYEPTETEPGLTDAKVCTVCATMTLPHRPIMPTGYGNIDRYASDYAYKALASLNNGEKLQELYNRIDEAATLFHTDTTIDAKLLDGAYVVGSFSFADLGLTSEDAITVWSSYKSDHPLYYWIASSFNYSDETLNLLTDAAYASGKARAEYNSLVFASVREYISCVNNESSPYRIALALHDKIIKNTFYAYKADGKTPEDAIWAHNVLGVFEKGTGVCESYARTFQLLLNYCEVENIYVMGESMGEDHAWNMVRMDNGDWYWFDLTWDDTPEWMFGVSYNYFCATDTQNVSWIDGPWVSSERSFAETHKPFTPDGSGTDYLYALPERAENEIDLEITTLRECFEVDAMTYTLISANEVQLVGILKSGDVIIPDVVSYGGYDYTVVSIGGMSGKLLKSAPVETAGHTVSSVYIPWSVSFIWDRALMLKGLEFIEVAEANESYTSLKSVLFTKGLYTLVQYPVGSDRTEYIIPDEVVEIANYSFGDGAPGKLKSITIGKGVSIIGSMNAGYGHRSDNSGRLNLASGDLFYMRGLMGFAGEINIADGNSSFVQRADAIYSADDKVLHFVTDRSLQTFTLPETVEILDVGAFFGCERMREVSLGVSVKEIRSFAFGYCASLQVLKYSGSEAEFRKVVLQTNWDAYAPKFSISCA